MSGSEGRFEKTLGYMDTLNAFFSDRRRADALALDLLSHYEGILTSRQILKRYSTLLSSEGDIPSMVGYVNSVLNDESPYREKFTLLYKKLVKETIRSLMTPKKAD